MSVWPFIVSPRLVLYICTFAYLRGQGLHCTGNLLFATNPGISQFLQSFNIYLASDWASRSCKSLEWYMLKSENHIFKTRMYSVSWNKTISKSTLKYTHTAKYPIVHFSIHCQKRDKGGNGGIRLMSIFLPLLSISLSSSLSLSFPSLSSSSRRCRETAHHEAHVCGALLMCNPTSLPQDENGRTCQIKWKINHQNV